MQRTFTHAHAGTMTLDLDVPIGTVTVLADQHATQGEVTIEPEDPQDSTAADLIERATSDSSGDTLRLVVPQPLEQVTSAGSARFARNITQVNVGSVVIGDDVVVSGGMINGRAVGTDRGAVRVVAHVPEGSNLTVATTSADVATYGFLYRAEFRSTSGDLRLDRAARVWFQSVSGDLSGAEIGPLRAHTTSGDVRVDTVDSPTVQTVSGDVDIRLTGRHAVVSATSGDVTVHAVSDGDISARTVSGDVRVTSDPGVRADIDAHSVSGRVRIPSSARP